MFRTRNGDTQDFLARQIPTAALWRRRSFAVIDHYSSRLDPDLSRQPAAHDRHRGLGRSCTLWLGRSFTLWLSRSFTRCLGRSFTPTPRGNKAPSAFLFFVETRNFASLQKRGSVEQEGGRRRVRRRPRR